MNNSLICDNYVYLSLNTSYMLELKKVGNIIIFFIHIKNKCFSYGDRENTKNSKLITLFLEN